jgi:hypothetical protein
MANIVMRELKPMPEAEALYRRWVGYLNEQFTLHQGADRRAEIVRDELYQLYLGHPRGNSKPNASLTTEMATGVLTESFDCRNVTMMAEYLEGIDTAKFAPRKPLLWFWQQFDRSPLGLNHWLGVRLRCMLGGHIFQHIGKSVKLHIDVQLTFGYNITIEDNCRIRRGAQLDDSNGPLVLPEGTVVEPGGAYVQR